MGKKGIIIILSVIFAILIATLTVYFYKAKQAPQITQSEKAEVLKENSQKFKDPYVLAIRKALNLYLTGKLTAKSDPLLVNGDAKLDRKGFFLTGLKNFNIEYYKSKFIAFKTMTAPDKGEIVYLEFIDKPDRVFTAGIFPSSQGTFKLEYFGQDQQVTQEKLQKLNTQYSFLLQDRTHAL
jgi:hypothetical protein